jgi:hypothetical protein
MVESLVLIHEKQGQFLDEDNLKGVSLMNAKHLVVGKVPGGGIILHVAANSSTDLGKALLKFSEVPGVMEVVTLMLRTGD